MTKPKDNPQPAGRPSKYDPAFCEQVVELMSQGYSLTAFCGKIDVARSTINEWMEAHPEFSEAVTRGKAARLFHWEDSALRVAKKGGGPGTATIIMFGLKNMGGDEWTAPEKVEHTGKDGGPIKTEVTSARDILAGKLARLTAPAGTEGGSGEPE